MNAKMRIFLVVFVLLGIAALASCNLPKPCTPAMLVAPQLQSPAMWEVVNSLQPSLTWKYPTVIFGPSPTPTLVPASGGSGGGGSVPGGPTLVPGTLPTLAAPVPPGGPFEPVPVPYFYPHPPFSYFPYFETPYFFLPYFWPALEPLPYKFVYTTASCSPQGYRVSLQTGPNFSDDLGGNTNNTHWSPSTPLQPATEYRWGVAAVSGGGVGPFAGYRYFFTGPLCECTPESLLAPTLKPLPASVNSLLPGLSWDYPGDCLPQGYRIDLSTDPSFEDTSLSGGTGNPFTHWGPAESLADCTTYYWRVAAVCDQPGGGTLVGPYSEVQSFSTQKMKVCPTLTPLNPSFIPSLDANCRKGPDVQYGLLAVAAAGQEIPILGRNPEGDWFYVRLEGNLLCWIARRTGETEGDTDQLPIVEFEPLPTRRDRTGGCAQYTDPKTCWSVMGCYWDSSNERCMKR